MKGELPPWGVLLPWVPSNNPSITYNMGYWKRSKAFWSVGNANKLKFTGGNHRLQFEVISITGKFLKSSNNSNNTLEKHFQNMYKGRNQVFNVKLGVEQAQ